MQYLSIEKWLLKYLCAINGTQQWLWLYGQLLMSGFLPGAERMW